MSATCQESYAPSQSERDKLVTDYMPLVKRIANRINMRLPESIEVDDLIQDGMIGLLDAVRLCVGSYNAKQFKVYAYQRIQGSIFDALRENDPVSRKFRSDYRKIESAISTLEQRNGCKPSNQDVANALDISLAEHEKSLTNINCLKFVHYEDFDREGDGNFLDRLMADSNIDPLNKLIEKDTWNKVIDSIDSLKPTQKSVIEMRYEEEMTLREIGEVLGVSESRACQIHNSAVERIRIENPCL